MMSANELNDKIKWNEKYFSMVECNYEREMSAFSPHRNIQVNSIKYMAIFVSVSLQTSLSSRS